MLGAGAGAQLATERGKEHVAPGSGALDGETLHARVTPQRSFGTLIV